MGRREAAGPALTQRQPTYAVPDSRLSLVRALARQLKRPQDRPRLAWFCVARVFEQIVT